MQGASLLKQQNRLFYSAFMKQSTAPYLRNTRIKKVILSLDWCSGSSLGRYLLTWVEQRHYCPQLSRCPMRDIEWVKGLRFTYWKWRELIEDLG
jgi:hypothetical protein